MASGFSANAPAVGIHGETITRCILWLAGMVVPATAFVVLRWTVDSRQPKR